MKTKGELIKNIELAEILLNDIKKEVVKNTTGYLEEETPLFYNTRLINRNRIIINQKLKELERYK